MKTNSTTITHAAIILADVPFNPISRHTHWGKHFYVVVSNPAACKFSPVLQAIPMSSNTNRRLPVQIEVHAECFTRRTYALAEQLTLLPRDILEQGKYCGILGDESLSRLKTAIRQQLSLD